MQSNEEIWKDIAGFEGYYQVSSIGRIRSLDRKLQCKNGFYVNRKGKQISLNLFRRGYMCCKLHKLVTGNKSISVHRVVALAFIPNPNNLPQINHKNGIKTDNRLENLEWCDASHNAIHAFATGLKQSAKGEKHGNAKLREKDIPTIRQRIKSGDKIKDISAAYGVCDATIINIKYGRKWRTVV